MGAGTKLGRRKATAKYRNRKVHYEGMKFDSIREFERYKELLLMVKAGVIDALSCQYRIKLACGGTPVKSKSGRQLAYIVDFKYYDLENEVWRYEDVKGYNTPLGDLKIAVVEAENDRILVEIVR